MAHLSKVKSLTRSSRISDFFASLSQREGLERFTLMLSSKNFPLYMVDTIFDDQMWNLLTFMCTKRMRPSAKTLRTSILKTVFDKQNEETAFALRGQPLCLAVDESSEVSVFELTVKA